MEVNKEACLEIFWMNSASPDAFIDLYDRFQADTGIKVDIVPSASPMEEPILAKWAAGERPDILDWHSLGVWFIQINAPETCQDLSDMEFVDKYKPEFKFINELLYPDGKIWGVNLIHPHVTGYCYNKEIFTELNLEIPKNYDEFFKLCGDIKDAGITPLYGAAQDAWPLQIDTFGFYCDGYKDDPTGFYEDLNTGKTNFVQPAYLDALNAVQKLLDAGYYQENVNVGTFAESQDALYNGDVAMTAQLEWLPQIIADNYGMEEANAKIGMFGISMESNCVPWGLWSPGACWVLPKTGDPLREAAAREFINYISGEGYEQFAKDYGMPAVLEGVDVEIKLEGLAEIISYFEKDSAPVFHQLVNASYGTYEFYMQEMFAGTKTPEDVAQALSDEFAKNAIKLGLPGWELIFADVVMISLPMVILFIFAHRQITSGIMSGAVKG